MPIFPSHVGGSGPRDDSEYEGSADGVRLRQLCECLLTCRSKMLGLSQSFAHRLSRLPEDLKSPLVSALGEIMAHLDSFEIKSGDTRLTGKAKLGADVGMEGHFPSVSEGLVGRLAFDDDDDRFRESSARKGERPSLEGPRQHPALPAPGGTVRRRRNPRPAGGVHERETSGGGERNHCAVRDDGDLRYCRECLEKPCRWFGLRSSEPSRPFPSAVDADDTYGHLYYWAQERWRQKLARRELSRLQHGLLCWVTLGAFTDDPERPEGSYEAREEALGQLEAMGYVRRVGRKWGPTPSGFEASGLVGTRGLELDP